MYFVLSKSKDNNFSVECDLKLFDSMVLTILLYGCEIWVYENTDIIESIHTSFLRHILPVKKRSPTIHVIWRTRKEASCVNNPTKNHRFLGSDYIRQTNKNIFPIVPTYAKLFSLTYLSLQMDETCRKYLQQLGHDQYLDVTQLLPP